jgi:chromosome segregation ATPase
MKLKRLLITAFGALLLVPAAPAAIAFAVDGDTNTTTSTETKPEDQTTETPDDKAALQERITKRKAELKTKLTNAQKLLLKGKCKASQGRLSSVSGRIKGIETSHSKVHTNIVERLTELSTKLKNKGVDTTELDATIETLQAKVTTFNADLVVYKQAITDLEAMDCVTDPDGFKASLEAARTALDKVKADSTDIRSYVKDTIKPILKTIREALEGQEKQEDQN